MPAVVITKLANHEAVFFHFGCTLDSLGRVFKNPDAQVNSSSSTPHIRISGGETKYQDFSFFLSFFNNPEFIWMRGKVWEPLSHILNPATPNICWCTGKNRNKIRCLSALREAAGSYLHFLFSGAVKQIFYLHSVHWKPMRVRFGKLAYFQINFSFLWKK